MDKWEAERYGLTMDGKVNWPKNPKSGDEFVYLDTIGGASFNFFRYLPRRGWVFLRNE